MPLLIGLTNTGCHLLCCMDPISGHGDLGGSEGFFVTITKRKCKLLCSSKVLGLHSLKGPSLYMFHPTLLVLRLVNKIKQDKAKITLFVPTWPRHVWYHYLNCFAVSTGDFSIHSPPVLSGLRSDSPSQLGSSSSQHCLMFLRNRIFLFCKGTTGAIKQKDNVYTRYLPSEMERISILVYLTTVFTH